MSTAQLGPDQRATAIARMEQESFDLVIIGGGVTGAGAALDAASRGLSVALLEAREEIPTELAGQAPAFPQPYYNQWASRTETATHTYNFCISPLTPFAVRGVAWIPGKNNISEDASKYSPSLKVYTASLAETYGQKKVPFLYAQPAASLVEGIVPAQIEGALSIEFDEWPKSLEAIATQLGTLAADKLK